MHSQQHVSSPVTSFLPSSDYVRVVLLHTLMHKPCIWTSMEASISQTNDNMSADGLVRTPVCL